MTIHKMAYAKTHLATLVKNAISGQDVVIARDEQPLVRLVPVTSTKSEVDRAGGDLEGRVSLPDQFFAPMSESEAADWGL